MANSSVRLPAVEPFELTDRTPPSAAGGGTDAALETELMADLGVLSQPYRRATAPAQSTTDPSAGRLNQGEPTVKPKWDSLDPDVVARRLAQLRRPQPKAEPPRRDAAPAQPRAMDTARADAGAASMPRSDTVSRLRPRTPSPAEQPRLDPVRAAVQRVEAHPSQAPGHLTRNVAPPDEGRVTDVLETALRDLIAEAAAHHRERERPSRKMIAVGALLLVGVGIGAILAQQWSSPRDTEVAAVSAPAPPVVAARDVAQAAASTAARVAASPADAKPAPTVQTASVAPPLPAPPAATGAAPVAGPPAAAVGAPATATATPTTPAPKQPVATANVHPSWLVEDDPVTFQNATTGQRGSAGATSAPPPWYVEDDAAAFDPAAAGGAGANRVAGLAAPVAAAPLRRMVVTADVDVRVGPDAKSESIGVLKAGAVVVVGECNLWCAVGLNAKTGWVFYTFLSETPAPVSAR